MAFFFIYLRRFCNFVFFGDFFLINQLDSCEEGKSKKISYFDRMNICITKRLKIAVILIKNSNTSRTWIFSTFRVKNSDYPGAAVLDHLIWTDTEPWIIEKLEY